MYEITTKHFWCLESLITKAPFICISSKEMKILTIPEMLMLSCLLYFLILMELYNYQNISEYIMFLKVKKVFKSMFIGKKTNQRNQLLSKVAGGVF